MPLKDPSSIIGSEVIAMFRSVALCSFLALAMSMGASSMEAQSRTDSPRVGTLTSAWGPDHPAIEGMKSGLRALGFEAGRNITFDDRYTEGDVSALPAAAAELARNHVDVIVTTNLFGDILSDLCSGLVGGLGLAPGANLGDTAAIFEAVHGSAPDIAGRNIANPCALVLASAMMLDHIGEPQAAERIQNAVAAVVKDGKRVTRDLNPDQFVSTTEMANAIIEHIRAA